MDLFIELLQIALGHRVTLSRLPNDDEWCSIYNTAQKQAIVGVLFEGIQVLSNEKENIGIPQSLLFEWIAASEEIKTQNLLLNKRVAEVSQYFLSQGKRSCILKGQGNAIMYPNPLSRMPGDIDIWVEGKKKDVTKIVRSKFSNVYAQYHHIDFPIFQDVEVEVHYKPSRINNPFYNWRLQRFYQNCKSLQFNHECRELDSMGNVCTPLRDFNLIFQLSHIINHFFTEGVGLRQLMDYYFLVRHGYSEMERKEYRSRVKHFGMGKFARSVMWVLKEVFGLEDRYLLAKPYCRGGMLLLKEVMATGNFGMYDDRYTNRHKGNWRRLFTDLYRDMTLAWVFPAEALSMPWAKLENQIYKSRK